MKLSARVDLDSIRLSALAKIDLIFAASMPNDPLSRLREVKASEAARILAGGDPHEAFHNEAAARGVTVDDLCHLIRSRHEDGLKRMLDHEGRRNAAKAAITAADDQHAVNATLLQIEGNP